MFWANSTVWSWGTPNGYTSMAPTLRGNQPGGSWYSNGCNCYRKLQSPLPLLSCGFRTGYSHANSWASHGLRSLNITFADGTIVKEITRSGVDPLTRNSGQMGYKWWGEVMKRYPDYRPPE